MKKRIEYILLGFLLCLTACNKEKSGAELLPNGMVRLEVHVTVPLPDDIQVCYTQGEEDALDRSQLYALIFRKGGDDTRLMCPPVKADYKGEDKIELIVPLQMDSVDMYIVGNLTADQRQTIERLKGNEKTKAEIGELLLYEAQVGGISIPFPMCSQNLRAPLREGNILFVAQMQRILAKIDIDASLLGAAEFELEEAVLYNAAKQGCLLPIALKSNRGGNVEYNKLIATANQISSQLYCFENSGKDASGKQNPTSIIIKGKYKGRPSSYYRLDIVYGTPKQYDVNRNRHYKIHIGEVKNIGYLSFEQARLNAASNDIDYTVSVDDPYANDVVGTGDYFLATSNTEYIIYGDEALNDMEIALITTNAPVTVNEGSITTETLGLTLLETKIERNNLPGERKNRRTSLKVNMEAGVHTGNIKLRIGNLEKEIVINRKPPISDQYFVLDFHKEFISAELISRISVGGDMMLFGIHADTLTAPLSPTVFSSTGDIYAHFFTNKKNASRYSEAYLSRKTESGRVKVRFIQKAGTP